MEELTLAQAAAYSASKGRLVSTAYLRAAVTRGRIKGARLVETPVMNYWLVNRAAIDDYLANSQAHKAIKRAS